MTCKCSQKIEILFSKKNDRCVIPTKRKDDAGYDLYVDKNLKKITIQPLETKLIPTGIKSVIPMTHYAQIQERGSTGVKGIKYGAGVIDSSYRGEWNVVITNCTNKNIVIYDDEIMEIDEPNDKSILYPMSKAIVQFVLLPVPETIIKEVSEEEILSHKTERMDGKLGSSNK